MPLEFVDPYNYPGTEVLRNMAGIRDGEVLRVYEYEQTALRMAELREHPIPGAFDLAHLKAIHGHVFQDVYSWAGQLRTVNLSKNGDRFAQPGYIESAARQIGKDIEAENNLQGLEKPQFVVRLAHYYTEYNALHPFREGNGRSTRELIGQLAREAGYGLDQTRIDNGKDQWNAAARHGFHGDQGPIVAILSDAIRPARAIAFEKLPEAEACAKHPELRPAFDGLRAIEDLARVTLSGDTARVATYMHQVRVQLLQRLDHGQHPERMTSRELEQRPERKQTPERDL
uniref:Fic/DOC family protein n=1 Tax=Acidovorax sp. SUPP3334 TaxID=2920881 RepID=UPI002952956C|nr:Fic family protein [Acidovorax sp. SUPP3334]BDH38375.1 Fic family protein [Acidovorax sp. SUPP3334]